METNPDKAHADLLTTLRLVKHLDSAPALIVAIVEINLLEMTLQLTWEGLKQRAWSEKQLEEIDAFLASFDLSQRLLDGLRADRASMVSLLMNHANGVVSDSRIAWVPQGVALSKTHALSAKLLDDHAFYPNGKKAPPLDFQAAQDLNAKLVELRTAIFGSYPHPYHVFSLICRTCHFKHGRHDSQNRRGIELARAAIQLELLRLQKQQYPETFPSTNKIIYRLNEDGTPLLYLPGLNGTDDGGIPSKELLEGDWVWQYSYQEAGEPESVDQ